MKFFKILFSILFLSFFSNNSYIQLNSDILSQNRDLQNHDLQNLNNNLDNNFNSSLDTNYSLSNANNNSINLNFIQKHPAICTLAGAVAGSLVTLAANYYIDFLKEKEQSLIPEKKEAKILQDIQEVLTKEIQKKKEEIASKESALKIKTEELVAKSKELESRKKFEAERREKTDIFLTELTKKAELRLFNENMDAFLGREENKDFKVLFNKANENIDKAYEAKRSYLCSLVVSGRLPEEQAMEMLNTEKQKLNNEIYLPTLEIVKDAYCATLKKAEIESEVKYLLGHEVLADNLFDVFLNLIGL